MTPVEMLGYVEFPPIEHKPYRLTLAPYSFLWLELQRRAAPSAVTMDLTEEAPLSAEGGWGGMFDGVNCERLETVNFPKYLPKQRWFAGKSRHIKSTRIIDWSAFNTASSALVRVEVQFDEGLPEVYILPLAMSFAEGADELRRDAPNAIVASIASERGPGLLYDGVFDDKTCAELLSLIENGCELDGRSGDPRRARKRFWGCPRTG